MANAPLPRSTDFVYVEIKQTTEDWNEYEADQGVVIRVKFLVVKFRRENNRFDELGNPLYSFESNTVLTTFVPKGARGTPSERPYTDAEVRASIVDEDVKFKILKENWNIYKLEDGTEFSVRPVLATLGKSSLFNEAGEQHYVVSMQPIIKGKVNPGLKKKP